MWRKLSLVLVTCFSYVPMQKTWFAIVGLTYYDMHYGFRFPH